MISLSASVVLEQRPTMLVKETTKQQKKRCWVDSMLSIIIREFLTWLQTNKEYDDRVYRTWAKTEWPKDSDYAYEMLKQGKNPNTH